MSARFGRDGTRPSNLNDSTSQQLNYLVFNFPISGFFETKSNILSL